MAKLKTHDGCKWNKKGGKREHIKVKNLILKTAIVLIYVWEVMDVLREWLQKVVGGWFISYGDTPLN